LIYSFVIDLKNFKNIHHLRALKNQGFWSIPNAFEVSEFKTAVPTDRDEDFEISQKFSGSSWTNARFCRVLYHKKKDSTP